MPVLAVVTSSPPDTEGGHLVIARAIVAAARDCGHDARLVVTPDYGFGRQAKSYLANWRVDVHAAAGARVDQVISLRYPSYAVRHDAHVCWLNHTMREYYDLWPRFSSMISRRGRVKERVRRALLHAADGWLLNHHVTNVIAQSRTIQRRLAAELGVAAEVLWPPPPPRAYRCDGYGPSFFTVSRLTPLKRLDLLVRAAAEPAARHVTIRIAGEGESRDGLERLIRDLGVGKRVTLLGRIGEDEMIAELAACRAVVFAPFDEDYGFVTVEAFASSKAVVTCADSGGPTELVRDEESGLVCEPAPAAIASALARLHEDARLAERLGANAAAQAAAMTWPAAIDRLLIATGR